MKITAIRTTPINIPRSGRLTTSYGSIDFAPTILVEIDSDEGITGIGQVSVDAPFYGETMAGMLANIHAHLAPALVGQDPLNITHCNHVMHMALPHHWCSFSGIDMALWDLKGKALKSPIYELMGGKVRDGVDLMGFVYHGTPAEMAQTAKSELDEHGYPVLKMKIGLDPREDVLRYRAVAEAVGDRAVIQVDGNTGYTIHQALPALAEMERIGALGTIEQPVASMEDLAEIAKRLVTPVMADEAIYPPEDAIEVVRRKAASIALMKINKHGGLTNVWKIGQIFEAAGLSLSIAIYYDLIGVAASHLAAALPCVTWPSPATRMTDTIVATPFAPEGLLLRVPDGPGLGVELDWDKVKKYALKG
ncbi:MAG: mandelate racemase/muconate lactonizing enzyme family protein [Caldilineaceae bacterium]